jgi:hypothetical protein
MTSPLLADYPFSTEEPNQVELQIVYLEDHATPSSYVMPDVISVEVQFGADIPPKLIQVRLFQGHLCYTQITLHIVVLRRLCPFFEHSCPLTGSNRACDAGQEAVLGRVSFSQGKAPAPDAPLMRKPRGPSPVACWKG